jgi:U32 family peptidase
MNGNRVELLAPCGGWEVLNAVVAGGADAIYFSEKRYAMRQHANQLNFTREELGDVVQYARENGVKSYITLNNLLTREELGEMPDYLLYLQSICPDALIIQDLGLLRLTRELDIGIDLHASTMMNVHHLEMASFLKQYGIKRIITSRDITIYEAREIAEQSGIEVEYFVHGDMCVAQGSQCFHSGIASEFSANRGKCLKSCRWQWNLMDRDKNKVLAGVEEQYVLARKDMCLYHQLPELISTGIASLKIEGRARAANYLRPIVGIYREAIDRYYDDPCAYSTDFDALKRLRSKTIRETGTSHAFGNPGVGSSGLSGKKEPRFFSIAVDERPYEEIDVGIPIQNQSQNDDDNNKPELSVRCRSEESAFALLDSPCDWIYVGGEHFSGHKEKNWKAGRLTELIVACHDHGKKIGIQTPRITTRREFTDIDILLESFGEHQPDEFLVHNIGTLNYFEGKTDVPLHADYSFNIWNSDSASLLNDHGIKIFTPGLELTLPQIYNLGEQSSTLQMECMIHGSMPGMLLEYCIVGTHMTGTGKHDPCPGPCTKRNYAMQNKLEGLHWLETDQYCRNHLFMIKDLCTIGFIDQIVATGANRLRIEGVLYDAEYLKKLVFIYHQALTEKSCDLHQLLIDIETDAARKLTVGAYGNVTVNVSRPCSELPTDMIITYQSNSA